jgi:hypothetical protein
MFWQVRSYNEKCYSLCLSHLEAATPLNRGDISVDLTNFSSINELLRAVKGTEERGEPHVDFIRHFGKSAFSMNKVICRVYVTWNHSQCRIQRLFSQASLIN